MPPKVYPPLEAFEQFDGDMRSIGFRGITRIELQKDFVRFGLEPPTPRKGREVGYAYHANGLTVRVWTSWLPEEESIREEDAGWVLIADGDVGVYFVPPLSRTKNFFNTLAKHAWVAQWRVINRPLCSECKKFMHIVRGRYPKQRYWICRRKNLHSDHEYEFRSWDLGGLPPRAKKFVDAVRKERRRYRKELKKEGKVVERAVFKRKGWKQTR